MAGQGCTIIGMPIYEASVEISFTARHSVRMPDGRTEPPHEHIWRASAAFRADRLQADGFVIDFLAARAALKEIADEIGGKDLDRIIPNDGAGASAERVAEYLAGRLQCKLNRDVYCVRVAEAPGCGAAVYPGRSPP